MGRAKRTAGWGGGGYSANAVKGWLGKLPPGRCMYGHQVDETRAFISLLLIRIIVVRVKATLERVSSRRLLTTPWGTCPETLLRAPSRIPKARSLSRRFTLGDGSPLLEKCMGDEVGHMVELSAWELRKGEPRMTPYGDVLRPLSILLRLVATRRRVGALEPAVEAGSSEGIEPGHPN